MTSTLTELLEAGPPPQVGEQAPDFELADQHGQAVRLRGLRGQVVVVVFFPHAFTPTCTGELCAIRDEGSAFGRDDLVTLAVSCDPGAALKAFAAAQRIDYPLLSDFWPHGEVSRRYGVFFPPRGFATRATFLVDRDGVVRWSVVNGPGDARSTDDYRAALAAL